MKVPTGARNLGTASKFGHGGVTTSRFARWLWPDEPAYLERVFRLARRAGRPQRPGSGRPAHWTVTDAIACWTAARIPGDPTPAIAAFLRAHDAGILPSYVIVDADTGDAFACYGTDLTAARVIRCVPAVHVIRGTDLAAALAAF